MERVTEIGGLFFRAEDSSAIGRWYRDHRGIDLMPTDYESSPWMQEAGPTVFAPFPKDSDDFGQADKHWMVNLRVRDLGAMMPQLRDAGIAVSLDPETHSNGRFGRIRDPEGNPIEL